ncbi:MAG TPA: cyclic nucleotide-gated ion channel [Rhizomicrobium sp.]|nr:cyclic nucleotide-gated ion channel [Rhizomicrobium sp.]
MHLVMETGRSSGRLGLAFEIFLIVLIVGNAIAVSLDSVPKYAAVYGSYFRAFEYGSVAIFTVEYLLRVWTVPEDPRFASRPVIDRVRYLIQPYMLIDFLAVAPAYVALFMPFVDLRILRLFRLFRLLKIARYSPAVATLIHVLSLERRALFGTLLLLLCIMSLCAEGMYIIEGSVQPHVFGNLPSCMYWAVITLTTVGYGDTYPITAAGRLLASVTAIMGLGLFALPVGIIASAFVTEIHRRDFVVTSSMLSRIPLFSGLDIEVMSEVMAALRSHMVAPHVPIVVAGETPTAIYFIVSGLAKETGQGRGRGGGGNSTLGPGEVIAVDAVLNGTTHEATIFAHTPMRLLALSNQDVAMLLRKYPRLRRRIQKGASQKTRRGKRREPQEEVGAEE